MLDTKKAEWRSRTEIPCAKQRARIVGCRLLSAWLLLVLGLAGQSRAISAGMKTVRVSTDRGRFVLDGTNPGAPGFTPWGFNYDHDEQGRLLEDYWDAEWPKVEDDFREMKELGANVVRIHLQTGKFMPEPDKASHSNLSQLARLVKLAQRTGLYLDITGLGCYHKKDVPEWYDALEEAERRGP